MGKTDIYLSSKSKAFIEMLIASGKYSSPDQIVEDAISALADRENSLRTPLHEQMGMTEEELKIEIEKGMTSEASLFDPKSFINEMHNKHLRKQTAL